jgi:hypothetical protein
MLRKERVVRLRDKFPVLAAEYPKEFRIFFDEKSNMTPLGQSVYGLIKHNRRMRMQKK